MMGDFVENFIKGAAILILCAVMAMILLIIFGLMVLALVTIWGAI